MSYQTAAVPIALIVMVSHSPIVSFSNSIKKILLILLLHHDGSHAAHHTGSLSIAGSLVQ